MGSQGARAEGPRTLRAVDVTLIIGMMRLFLLIALATPLPASAQIRAAVQAPRVDVSGLALDMPLPSFAPELALAGPDLALDLEPGLDLEKAPALENLPALAAAKDAPAPQNDPGLALDGLFAKNTTLFDGSGSKVGQLGAGAFGRVFPHPARADAVVKITQPDVMIAMFEPRSLEQWVAIERGTARALHGAGVGPRFFGVGALKDRRGSRPVSVKERVYGETMEKLIRERRFSEEDSKLLAAMLERLAAARLRVDDPHPRNIMFGTTQDDPVRRAYLVDGGNLLPVEDGETPEDLVASYWHQKIIVKAGFQRDIGYVEHSTTLQAERDKGLQRTYRPEWWVRAARWLRATLAASR